MWWRAHLIFSNEVINRPPPCATLLFKSAFSYKNGHYDGDKFCNLTHRLYAHSCFTARRRSPEGADIWRRASQRIQDQSHQEGWLLSQWNAKQLSVFNIGPGLSCFSFNMLSPLNHLVAQIIRRRTYTSSLCLCSGQLSWSVISLECSESAVAKSEPLSSMGRQIFTQEWFNLYRKLQEWWLAL